MSGLVDLYALTDGGPGCDSDGDRVAVRLNVDPGLVALAPVRVIVQIDRLDRAELARVLAKLASFVSRLDNPIGQKLRAAGQDDWGFDEPSGRKAEGRGVMGLPGDPTWPGKDAAGARNTGEAAERWLQDGAPERPDDQVP